VALAPYFDRAALAAAQVLSGFDEKVFRKTLEGASVGLSIDAEASTSHEGKALAELSLRLLARLYPRLQITSPDTAAKDRLGELARRINPRIELVHAGARLGIAVGDGADRFGTTVFAGSDGWVARVSAKEVCDVGSSSNPFGAGTAACFAAANIFRYLFLGGTAEQLDDLAFSSWTGERTDNGAGPPLDGSLHVPDESVLVGIGAIGNGALWALSKAPLSGDLCLVDPQSIELSNVQRYVLTEVTDEEAKKTSVAERALRASELRPISHPETWDSFVDTHGYDWSTVAIAVDSADGRRAIQATLPKRIMNAWTQPGDLGVSLHSRFGGDGACVRCLYLPARPAPNEDELVAQALGIPERQQQVRDLLHHGAPVPPDLLEAVALALQVPSASLEPFAGRSIRELYVEGLCGGAVIGLERIDAPRQEVHVPLAHQSALAGVLLAAGMVRHWLNRDHEVTTITRINILRSLGAALTSPAKRSSEQRCICHDIDYVGRYTEKWSARNR
jgi:molybdopterin/thiamine biosynthesis adenylyltransferase